MFLSQEDSLDLNKFLINEWTSFAIFHEDLLETEEEILLVGHGFLNKLYETKFYNKIAGYVIKINKRYFIFSGFFDEKETEDYLIFNSIIEVDEKFIANYISADKFQIFLSPLSVDAKYYQYQSEEKITFSKKGVGNIDLYASYALGFEDKKINGKIYNAAFTAAKNMSMTNALNERFANIEKK